MAPVTIFDTFDSAATTKDWRFAFYSTGIFESNDEVIMPQDDHDRDKVLYLISALEKYRTDNVVNDVVQKMIQNVEHYNALANSTKSKA